MKNLIKPARISYGILIAALAIQQIFYKDFRPVILPPWHPSITGYAIYVYVISTLFIAGGVAIIFEVGSRPVSLILGGVLLLLFCICQIPYELIVDPYYKHFGVWVNALKELAMAGGAFVVAGSFMTKDEGKENSLIMLLERLIPLGNVFFCIMIVGFGIDHFLYADGISTLVPNWMPLHLFWTYFAGVALIGSGLSIILRIRLKLSSLLLALMIFLWLVLLHIPRAFTDPYSLQGNEVSSVFEAFGFSGIAFLMAYGYHTKK
ncbi:hypothetical protein JN11_00658 [Mucilaginibacter frigoritolerans]|uniref:DoxX-like protein n=1 Tax=Mucilaginibacter frigoritolerans TaxID=652788 RepID=A0A562UI17_9SPHI|nr:hypothetical protein [Mucilaginibacter frigoritolerans]TWJ04935.1 hypothetical protein JN11_00658 [Mucilaginibacter frigoritolerans]